MKLLRVCPAVSFLSAAGRPVPPPWSSLELNRGRAHHQDGDRNFGQLEGDGAGIADDMALILNRFSCGLVNDQPDMAPTCHEALADRKPFISICPCK